MRTTDRIEDGAAWLLVLLGFGVAAAAVRIGLRIGQVQAVAGWAWGGAVALAGWGILGLAWLGLRAVTARRNARAWDRAWERVEPEWSRRAP